MVSAIIFDFDGVIHNTFELAYGVALKVYPGITRDEYRDFFNGNVYDHKKVSPEFRKLFFDLHNAEFEKISASPEIKAALLRLSRRYSLFIISSNSEKTLLAYLERSGIPNLFKEVWGIETHASKVEKFSIILKKHRLGIADCIFVTDTLGDIVEANKVGILTIALDCGFHERSRLEKGRPALIISSFGEIAAAVKQLSGSLR